MQKSKRHKVILTTLLMGLVLNNSVAYGFSGIETIKNPIKPTAIQETETTQEKSYTEHIRFVVESKEVYHNNELFLSNNPNTVRDGVTYISLRTFSERLGLSVDYDINTKEAKISNEQIEIKFRVNQAQYKVNDQVITSTHGVPFIENGTTMIPLRIFVNHFNMKVHPQLEEKSIHLYWDVKPIAKFSVEPKKIYAGQTKVTYIDEYTHSKDLGMINEIWLGKKEVFNEPGKYTVKRIVQDENGVWSELFELEINVSPANEAPIASFFTNKDQYLIGEPIIYVNQSYDDENAIVSTTWTNKESAFFTAGEQEVSLEVVDQHGLSNTYTKKIMIQDKILYTREQFNPWFTPVGQKYLYGAQNVISFPNIKYGIEDEEHILYRSNSPESIREEGIYYRDIVQGNVRVMIHQQNNRSNPVNLYVIATNHNDEPVEIKAPHVGMAGPHELVTTTGKIGLARYLESLKRPNENSFVLEPGKSMIILPEISSKKILENQSLSVYADIRTSLPVEIQTAIIDTGKEIFEELPQLIDLPKDGIHTRGTFNYGNRVIRVRDLVGEDTRRIVFGDHKEDVRVLGIDQLTGEEVLNQGNFGVLYKLKLERVAPRSLILLNARGGHYSGAFLVNNEVVLATDGSHLLDSREVAVLYRSGDVEEEVEIVFIPASGSNLPINIVIQPLPEKRH